jgi:RNA-directed DNA polymerase
MWTEPAVWTDRMLTALEQGVKGGMWFSLIDKVYSPRNLGAAYTRVKANRGSAGVDCETIDRFGRRLDQNLKDLEQELRVGTYCPRSVKRTWIPKPGSAEKRPLGIPTVRDRVVQTAIRNVLEPIFEKDFAPQSYGFRPNRGCKDALRRVDALLKAGYQYVVDADLKGYFDSIPHEPLVERVAEKVSDGEVLELIRAFLKQDVMDGLERWQPQAGSPQGAVISPLLSNIYLDPLDHLAVREGFEMVRYADDFVILCRSKEEAQRALAIVQRWTDEAGLQLHPTKTHIADAVEDGFDFLGYRFFQNRRWVRKKSLKRFKDTVRQRTPRNNGHSLAAIIQSLNPLLRGWYGYFQHAFRSTFVALDGWIRGRLRTILRRRRRRNGRARGRDHQRWPNAFFTEQGLFSLAAHATARQSASADH